MFAKKSMKFVLVVISFIALGLGFYAASDGIVTKKDMRAFNGTYLEQPRPIKTFSLKGIDDKTFDNAALKGQWTMMFFGFTQCGSICPTTMAELGKMYKKLEASGVKRLPRVTMISLDPKRDSAQKLAEYVKAFDPHFYGARAASKVVKPFAKEMGVAYAKITMGEDPQNYDIEHTGTIMLFNPEGKLTAFFTMPHDAEALAKDYTLLVG